MHTGLPALKSPAREKSFYFKFSLTSHLSILFGNERLLPEPPQPPRPTHTHTKCFINILWGRTYRNILWETLLPSSSIAFCLISLWTY